MDEAWQWFFAVGGFLISTTLGILKIIEFQRDRPRVRATAKFGSVEDVDRHPTLLPELTLTLTNCGRRDATIVKIGTNIQEEHFMGEAAFHSSPKDLQPQIGQGFTLKESQQRILTWVISPKIVPSLPKTLKAFAVLSTGQRVEAAAPPLSADAMDVLLKEAEHATRIASLSMFEGFQDIVVADDHNRDSPNRTKP